VKKMSGEMKDLTWIKEIRIVDYGFKTEETISKLLKQGFKLIHIGESRKGEETELVYTLGI